MSKIDQFYRRLILTKFYTQGWGKPEDLKTIFKLNQILSNRVECAKLVPASYPVSIDKEMKHDNCKVLCGHFVTPLMNLAPDLVPAKSKIARFEMVLSPDSTTASSTNNTMKAACIHMAGTGDHGFNRRRELMAKPLLSAGISSVLLENPFYGSRKPKNQFRSSLLHVNDLFVMGACLILEAQVLLHWLKSQGFELLGLTGISMGGHMASLAATNWPEPIALIPCMSWTSSSVVWTEGVLSKSIPWRVLESQYAKNPYYESEISKLLQNVDSYELGKNFACGNDNRFDEEAFQNKGSQSFMARRLALQQRKSKLEKQRKRQRETILFMKGVMDEVTHLANYSIPVDPELVTFVVAKEDAYYPQSPHLPPMNEVWPRCDVREIDAGHVSGCLIHHPAFITAILDTFQRLLEKHHMADVVADCATDNNHHEYKNVSETISKLPKFNKIYPSDGNPVRNFLKAIYAITST